MPIFRDDIFLFKNPDELHKHADDNYQPFRGRRNIFSRMVMIIVYGMKLI